MRNKPCVVMVHGGPGGDHTVAKPFFSQLTDIAQVIYYDHRGNGRSDLGTEDQWNLDQWAEDLNSFCCQLGLEKPIIIGTSFGGFVSLAYATQFSSHAGGLVLISTAAKVTFSTIYDAFERVGGSAIREIAQAYWDAPTDEGRERYKQSCVPFYTQKKNYSSDWMSRIIWRNETALWFNGPHNEHGRFDFRNGLLKIACPTLVMVGEEDPITPPEFSDEIVSGLNKNLVSYHKFSSCGHGVIIDKPDEALQIIREFILNIAVASVASLD